MKAQVFVVVISALGLATAAVPALKNGGITIGTRFYYASPTTSIMTHAQAVTYCAADGGELGKILNSRTYVALRAGLSTVGNYWVDGTDTPTFASFESDKTCSAEEINLTGVNTPSIRPPVCLALSKTTLATTSGVLALACEQRLRAVCAIDFATECGSHISTTTDLPVTP